MADPLPQAERRPRQRWPYVWMLPVIAVLLVAGLMTQNWQQRGPLVDVQFRQGHGLKAGDDLRYRGVAIGQVEALQLTSELDRLQVSIRLQPSAADIARAGSRFWIVRPQINTSGALGLDTVIGPNYLSVLPGDGEPEHQFIGLEHAPPQEVLEPGGLDIVLRTPGKGNLRPGAPISYRHVIIGTLVSVDLAKDASAVEAKAYIKADYVNLIRENVKFWRGGGARLSAGLSGLSVDVESVPSLILGGLHLAIPPQPGQRVSVNTRFQLHDRPNEDWLEWVPGLAVAELSADELQRPELASARLSWEYRNWLYWKREARRWAWLLPLDMGLLGPVDVMLAQNDVDNVQLMINDQIMDPLLTPIESIRTLPQGLALLPLAHKFTPWPRERLRQLFEPEDSLIIAGADMPVRYAGREHYRSDGEGRWQIESAAPFTDQWHGAAVLAEQDAALIGILQVKDKVAKVMTFSLQALSDDQEKENQSTADQTSPPSVEGDESEKH